MSEPLDPAREGDSLSTADLAGAVEGRPTETRAFADDGERDGAPAPMFPPQEADDLHADWDAIQAAFVDEPRQAVERADELVARTMKRLAESFAAERAKLEGQWDRGDDVSTEDLRQALRRYRAFFGRLLEA